jgi:uncharacterized protein YqgC (DUF456 family)
MPGIPILFISTLVYAIADKFQTFTGWQILALGLITLASIAVDYSSGLIGAKLGGANKVSLISGLVGMIIGLVSFPPFGLFLGLFLGVLLAELAQMKHHLSALRSATFSLIAVVIGMIVNIFLATVFLVYTLIILL